MKEANNAEKGTWDSIRETICDTVYKKERNKSGDILRDNGYQKDRNFGISQIRHKQKEDVDACRQEYTEKNLRISQIHHKRKEKTNTEKTNTGKTNTCQKWYIEKLENFLGKTFGKTCLFEKWCKRTFEKVLSIILVILILITTTTALGAGMVEEEMQGNNLEAITTYYVAKNGKDSNPGTEALPWLTIEKAANTISAGSTVYIKSGVYKERLLPKNSGSAGKYITFAAYPGHSVTLDGTGIAIPNWNGIVQINDKNYINIIGFRIINSKWVGIYAASSSYINFKNNYIYNTISSGIATSYGNNYIIDGNEIVLGNVGSTDKEILSIEGTNIFEIMNNYVHDGKQIGIDAKNGASNGKIHHNKVCKISGTGIYIDAWDKTQKNIDIYSNTVCSAGNGISIAAERGGILNDISIYNNLLYDNLEIGLKIPMVTHFGNAHLNNIKVFNNVLYHNGYNGAFRNGGIRIGQATNTYINNLIVRNNIVSQNDFYQIKYVPNAKYTGIVIDHNLIDGYRGTASEVRGANYVDGNPLFVDTALRNFRLTKTSPAIDMGSSNGAPSVDFEGVSRPKGAEHDIGSYEYIGTVLPMITIVSPNGGEKWKRGTAQTITWTKTGNIGAYVKIELLKNGVLNRVINSNVANSGLFNWTIPSSQKVGIDYKIRVASVSNSAYKDISNGNFVIS